jgi:cytoskeletal protein CcmA (bactofilin family)
MAKPTESPTDMAINRIVEGTAIEGEIRCESNIRIDGSFKGNLTTKGRLVIGPAGLIDGTVSCQNAEVEGVLKGKIQVQQLLSLKGSARIEGDIVTDKLSVEPGSSFSGNCTMGGKLKDLNKETNQGQPIAGAR